MRKYKNLYQHDGKWYTKEKRVAKVGEKVLIVTAWENSQYKNGDVLTVIGYFESLPNCARYGNKIGEYLYQQEYMVLVPYDTQVKVTNTDTYWDEFTQMEQQHNFVIQERGAGKKAFMAQLEEAKKAKQAQAVPFSKEYYNAPRKVKIGDWVEALTLESGEIIKGGKYQVLALNKYGSYGVYVRSPLPSIYDGDCSNEKIRQPFSYLTKTQYKLCPEPSVADTINSIGKTPKEQYTFKRKWTEAEIEEARRTVLLYNMDTKYMVDAHNTNIVGAYWLNPKTKHYQCATATCMKNDTFDYWIGRMVACLKVHDKQLPEWVKGGSK